MEVTPEERIALAEAALIIVETALLKLKEIQGDEVDPEDVEFETVLGDLEKYSKSQLRMSKGY